MDKLKFKLKNLKNKLFSSKNIRIKLSIFISVVGLLCLIIGSSYAILENNIESENKQVINVGKVKLELIESKGGMNIESLIDMTDEEGFNQENFYSFHISNVGDTPAEYDLLLVSESDSTTENVLDEDYIKVGLEINGEKTEILNLGEVNNIIHSTVINKSEDISYTLRVWLDPDTIGDNSLVDYTVSLKLKVNATQYMGDVGEQNTFYNIMKSESESANISYKYINNANITIDGITYNNNDNGIFQFYGTDDNEGSLPIYYYRGNVTNNNVLFGGFCWKIVRTTSTGGTKLIYNGLPDENGACNNTGDASQLSSTSAFNENYDSPAYVGYMYGTVYTVSSQQPSGTIIYGNDVTYSDGTYTLVTTTESSDWSTDNTTLANGYHYTCFSNSDTCTSVYYIVYFGYSSTAYYLTFTGGDNLDSAKEKMYTNTTDSTIKTAIDTWYSENLTDYTENLENTIFCNDRSSASDETYTVTRWEENESENGGALSSKDTNAVSYSVFKSYENTGKGTPSLRCENQIDRFSLSTSYGGTSGYGNNALTYPVGLLTLDEVELAGSQYISNSNYYLYTGTYYRVLSPASLSVNWAIGSSTVSDGGLQYSDVNTKSGVRPVVSLKPGTQVLSGSGTVNDPYVVTK